nr:3D domain-containing protein [uncultured Cellulosilyticum sp.]
MKNRSRIALLIVVLFMLGAVSITAYQSMSKIITLVDDGKVTRYETDASSVQELLTQLEITLNDKDTVDPDLNTKIEDNLRITIDRWKPTVKFVLNGEEVEFKTDFKTVGDIIKAKGLSDEEGITVEPVENTAITDGMKIVVKTKETKTVTEERPMSFETVVKETTDLEAGETKVTQEGQNGLKKVTTEQTYVGGELVNEEVTNVEIVQEPTDKIVLKGIRNSVKDTTTGEKYAYKRAINVEATAYTAYNGDGWGNQTASGMTTAVGVVAVDPNVIPLGTRLYIEGYGLAVAGDTGGAIKGNRIDLFFNTSSECTAYGRQNTTVYILEDQDIALSEIRR